MKKFVWKVCVFTAYILLLTVFIPAWIDPYNVFHVNHIRDNGVEPNKNYIKMKYVLQHPDKFDSFLFGSSRVGSIHVENIPGERCYNMTYSIGLPAEHLDNIKSFIKKNIIPKRVYIGVDSFSYTENRENHYTQPLRCPYEYAQSNPIDFYSLYFDLYIAIESLRTTFAYEPRKDYDMTFYEYGWWCEYGKETEMDWSSAVPEIGADNLLYETLDDIREIVNICNEYGIELIVFTNPMHQITYEASLEKDYLVFLKELAAITPYYNFSGLNAVTLNTDNYLDTSHYNAYIGDMMIDCICNGVVDEDLYEDGFGVYVTKENVEELILKLAG